jgi:hypothetical protein
MGDAVFGDMRRPLMIAHIDEQASGIHVFRQDPFRLRRRLVAPGLPTPSRRLPAFRA